MKHIRLTLLVLSLSVAAMALFGCAQPPREEEKAAKDAVAAARTAEAPVYASKEWTDADQLFTTAETKMSDKEYGEAKKLFLEASEKAKIAKESAERNKADLSKELAQSKEAAQKAVEQVRTEFGKLRNKVSRTSVVPIEAAIKDAEGNLTDANQLIASGKLKDAKSKLAAASSKADEATTALAAAMTPKHKPMASKPTLPKGKK